MLSVCFKLMKWLSVAAVAGPLAFYASSLLLMGWQTHRGPYAFFMKVPGDESVTEKTRVHVEKMMESGKSEIEISKFLEDIGFDCKSIRYDDMDAGIKDLTRAKYGKLIYNITSCFYRIDLLNRSLSTHIYSDTKKRVLGVHTSYNDPLAS